MTTIATCH